MGDLAAALALVFVIEGVIPFLAPSAWKQAMREAIRIEDRHLRLIGAASMVLGLLLLRWVR